MFVVERRNYRVLATTLKFNHKTFIFQVDSEAAVSIISEEMMERLCNTSLDYHIPRLVHFSIKLRTFSGELIPVIGQISIISDNDKLSIELFIVKRSVPSIAGRSIIEQL